MQTDQDLVSLMAIGNEAAFTEIYNRYWDVAYKAAYNVLRDDEACMDVVQDIFIWLWNHRAGLTIHSLRAYILTAVRFKVLNVLNQGRFRSEVLTSLAVPDSGEFSTDISYEIKELRAFVDQFMESLPEQARLIFKLSRIDHLSHKEIAEKL